MTNSGCGTRRTEPQKCCVFLVIAEKLIISYAPAGARPRSSHFLSEDHQRKQYKPSRRNAGSVGPIMQIIGARPRCVQCSIIGAGGSLNAADSEHLLCRE